MVNRVSETYFQDSDFGARVPEILKTVCAKTGFEPGEELFRGTVYEKKKTWSVIVKGIFERRPAVLKLEGLKMEMPEDEMLQRFTEQNQSAIIRVPKLYHAEPWSDQKRYAYFIFEYIDAPTIFNLPFASDDDMKDFANFYQEYKTRAVTKPWIAMPDQNARSFVEGRLANWIKASESKGRLKPDEYQPCVARFKEILAHPVFDARLEFCHGHLTANDIRKTTDGQYVLTSNLFWSYRPRWYDLAFNLWACGLHIRDTSFSFQDLLAYLERWKDAYRTIPAMQTDPNFEKRFIAMQLERTIGAILMDLGVAEPYEQELAPWYPHLLDLHQKLFIHLADRLASL